MKQKKIWSFDTASKVAAAKSAKYDTVFVVVPAPGGGFFVQSVAATITTVVAGDSKSAQAFAT